MGGVELNNFEIVIDRLTDEQTELQKMYCKRISGRFGNYTDEELQFIFTPFFAPTVWGDAVKVFHQSLQAFLPLDDGEIPIVFVGASMQNRLTRKRSGIGFLLTDRVLYVKEGGVFGEYVPKVFPLVSSTELSESALQIAKKAADSFDWTSLDSIASQAIQDSLYAFLPEAVLDTLLLQKEMGIERIERVKAKDILGRIMELGLNNNSCCKCGDDLRHAKHFKKVFNKFNVPSDENILFSVTDSTLAGPYGMVITDKGVHSKDLMEEPVHTERSILEKNYPIRVEKSGIIIGEGQVHTIPDSLDEQEKNGVVTLVSEVLAGEVTL